MWIDPHKSKVKKNGMTSQRHVVREYNEMIELYKDNEARGINCYRCTCGKITKTIAIDSGVTPFKKLCECGRFATSSFGQDIAPDQEPTLEWYRPTLKQALKMRKDPQRLDHVLHGGLEFREIEK